MTLRTLIVYAFTLLTTVAYAADEPLVVDVWPAAAPGDTRHLPGPEKVQQAGNVIRGVTNVIKPTLSIYRPPKDKETGVAVIICPGGGYGGLAWDHEGIQVAQWLNSCGVTGIILKYRVPAKRGPELKGFIPLMDAQRAVSLVRSKAGEMGLDAKRIGMLGFSAGGNLSALACTNFDQRSYDPVDDVDKVSCRPDFGVLIYPAYLLVEKSDQLSPLVPVTSQTPPIFFVHANDDGISAAGSAIMYLALKKAGVLSELHIYSQGGHGFGMRPSTRPYATWPQRCEDWMKSIGLLKPAENAGQAGARNPN